jgi:hypothetical protein
MVINDPTEFKILKKVWRNGNNVMEWVDMRKGVAYLFRYREVWLAANGRYLDALAEVDDPTDAIQTLDRITTRKQLAPKRTVKAFNPVAREDHQLFQVLLNGQHCVRGFSNPDIRDKTSELSFLKTISDAKRQSAKVSRLLYRCHAHRLIARVPHSRRWRVTRLGRIAMAASIQFREIQFPAALCEAGFLTRKLSLQKGGESIHKESIRKNTRKHPIAHLGICGYIFGYASRSPEKSGTYFRSSPAGR